MKHKQINNSQKTVSHKPDFLLLIAVIVLVLFGLLMIYNASPITSERDFGDPVWLVRKQLVWAVGGSVVAFFAYLFPFKFWEKFAPVLLLGAIGLLVAVFIPGIGINIYGAQRWIGVGNLFSIQPSDFAKLAYIIYLAAFLSKKVKFWPFVTLTAVLLGILIFQRDLGTAIVISLTGLLVYFLSGAPLKHFFLLIPGGLLSILIFVFSSDYRRTRFLTFLNPSSDPEGAAYHINQILIALGSGGWFGVGLGQSRQKYGYIPEITTDSIFAVIGNELGFIGSIVFISVLFFVVFRAFKISANLPDRFSQLLASGIGIWIGLQVFINLAGMMALLPLTGVPLPFISYGGSALLSVFLAMAILLQLSRHTTIKEKR